MREPVVPQDLRVSDAERALVAAGLQRAHDAGQPHLEEVDQRVLTVRAARTRGDLAGVPAGLPALPPPPPPARVFSDDAPGPAVRSPTAVRSGLAVVDAAV